MSDNKESKKLNIEIDGASYEAKPNQSIIEIADANGIYIPRFCYHKKLSVAANCRMCLVDVEGARRASPACATPVMDGMKVRTRSETSLKMQKNIMEFLLINHPLDCPICDQGGECELQDIAVGYGKTTSDYKETKRAVADPDIGSLVSTEMTRCILCTRCVRFGTEIAGIKELGVMGRGEESAISTYIKGDMLDSEISGNVIDLCPVGALTSKPFRYKARAWELKQLPTVSAGDGLAVDINAHIYKGEVVRVVPRESAETGTWISDRDRFEYTGLYSEDRIKMPMIKKSGGWVDVSWEEALDFVKVAIEYNTEHHGAQSISAVVSETSTTEEMYMMKKLLVGLGSTNIDSRIRQNSAVTGVSSGRGLGCSIEDIEASDFVLAFGSNIRKEYPLINVAVKNAVEKNKASAFAWNICEYDFNYDIHQVKLAADSFNYAALALLKAICVRANISYGELDAVLRNIDPAAEIREMADKLVAAENPKIIIGQDVVNSSDFNTVFTVYSILEKVSHIKGGFLPTSVNSVAAERMFASSKTNFSTYKCLNGETDTKLLFIAKSELSKDSVLGEDKLKASLEDTMVVTFSAFADKFTKEISDIIIPVATHYETSGSFVNAFGMVKEFKQVAKPYAENKELWRVLRVLGNLMNLEGFGYNKISEVTLDAHKTQSRVAPNLVSLILNANHAKQKDFSIVLNNCMYSENSLVRRAKPLQETTDAQRFVGTRISAAIADALGVETIESKICIYNIDNEVELDVVVDNSLHSNNIMMPRHLFKEFMLGDNVSLKQVNGGVE